MCVCSNRLERLRLEVWESIRLTMPDQQLAIQETIFVITLWWPLCSDHLSGKRFCVVMSDWEFGRDANFRWWLVTHKLWAAFYGLISKNSELIIPANNTAMTDYSKVMCPVDIVHPNHVTWYINMICPPDMPIWYHWYVPTWYHLIDMCVSPGTLGTPPNNRHQVIKYAVHRTIYYTHPTMCYMLLNGADRSRRQEPH